MSQRMKVLTNARVLTRTDVFRGTVVIRDGMIDAIDPHPSSLASAEDLEGDWLLPGLVELHTDNLEKHVSPRPGVRWPGLPAAIAHDSQLVAAGITTVFDAIALGDVIDASGRLNNLSAMVESLSLAQDKRLLRADHYLHIRCELSHAGVLDLLAEFVGHPRIRLVSLMDHSPGQRQFTRLDKYKEYYQGKYRLSDAELDAFIESQILASQTHSSRNRQAIVELSHRHGWPMASHDDATQAHVDEAAALGMCIAEFPTTVEAARAARQHGMQIMMGAPNLVRGQSHSGNVSATELARENLLDMVSSDYVPVSLLQAGFLLHHGEIGLSMPQAIAAVSLNPARAAGLDDRGEIAHGKRADLLRVREVDHLPVVLEAWRGGQRIY